MMNGVRAVSVLALLCFPTIAAAQLRTEVIATGLDRPIAFVADPVIANVFYIVQQGGVVRVMQNGQLLPTPFIDLSGAVSCCGERGLLGMAFPPDAATTGRVFFNFTNQSGGHTVVARFTRTAGNPLVAVPGTRLDLQWSTGERFIRQPFSNHNGGNLAFGPDGCLYIALGDGGDGNDPQNNAQNPGTLLGKVLRINTVVPDSDPNGFTVPPDNPFLDGVPIPALPEIWSFGWRNPWRYSFDDFGAGATGALIVGDVGQGAREEIDYEPFGAGGRNYGWRMREGTILTPNIPATTPAFLPLTDPIHDYDRSVGSTVTGGYVYRGSQLPAQYRGRYFFADFSASRVWSMGLSINPITGDATRTDVVEHTAELGGAAFLGGIASFGRDLQGELYLATFAGRILRIASAGAPPPNAPQSFQAVVTNQNVLLSWNPPASGPLPSQYQLEAGSTPGGSDLLVAPLSASPTSLLVAGVPLGTYYVRLRSVTVGGASQPSNEVVVMVSGGCTSAPPAPFGFVASVSGQLVALAWSLSGTNNGPTAFVIEAGSAPGLADLAQAAIDGSLRGVTVGAPPRTYYVRLRSANACGTSGPSNEIVVTIP
jgi:glucose/arabinose dehydrogenase